jgi:hypothetical protein
VQRNVTALEDSSGADSEVQLARITAVETAFAFRDSVARLALGALRAVFPQAGFDILASGFHVRERLK